MSYSETGKVFTPDSLRDYLKAIPRPSWCKGVTLHHCAAPSLAQRPQGLKVEHLHNLRDYYQNKLGWSAAPHFFIDEDQIWAMSPVTQTGTHAKSFNATHIGIEVLGDYDSEDPTTGRGRQCWQTTMDAVLVISEWLGVPNESFNFHRDDPKTNKTCPGKKVTREFLLSLFKTPEVAVLREVPNLVPVADTLMSYGVSAEFLRTHFDDVRAQLDHDSYDKEGQKTVAPFTEIIELRLPLSAFTKR